MTPPRRKFVYVLLHTAIRTVGTILYNHFILLTYQYFAQIMKFQIPMHGVCVNHDTLYFVA